VSRKEAKLRRIDTLVWAEDASKAGNHAERMSWIERNVPASHRTLVLHLLPDFLALVMADLPSKEDRRAFLDDIPDDCDPNWTKQLVALRVQQLWEARKKRR